MIMKCLLIDTAISAYKHVIRKEAGKVLKSKELTKGIGYSVSGM